MNKIRWKGVFAISLSEVFIGILMLLYWLGSITYVFKGLIEGNPYQSLKWSLLSIIFYLFLSGIGVLIVYTGVLTFKLEPLGRRLNLILAYFMAAMFVLSRFNQNVAGAVDLAKTFTTYFLGVFLKSINYSLKAMVFYFQSDSRMYLDVIIIFILVYYFNQPKIRQLFK